MVAGFASAGLKEFELALDEIAESLRFLATATKLRPRLSPVLNREVLHGEIAQLANDFINFKTVELASHHRGLIVVISGAFEQLVRRLIEDAVNHINGVTATFDEVPEGIQNQNIYFTGRALSAVREPPDHLSVDYITMAIELGACRPGAQKFKLNAAAFAMFITNLTPLHLVEVCRSVGVKLDWDYFGRIAVFETICGSKGTRATANAVSARLAESVKLRNRIAHTGAGGVTVSEDVVNGHLTFFRALGQTLTAFFGSQL